MSDERARWKALTTAMPAGDDEGEQGLVARVKGLLDRLGPRDVAAFAKLVERDRSYGERPARDASQPEPEPEPEAG